MVSAVKNNIFLLVKFEWADPKKSSHTYLFVNIYGYIILNQSIETNLILDEPASILYIL